VLVGPRADPARVAGGRDAAAALAAIAGAHAPFASRGDDSGTNRMELRLWGGIGIAPRGLGPSYKELGQGMGPTLNAAAAMGAYTITDRATWANFKNRGDLAILVEGDPALFNPYGSILVTPARFPHVKAADARTWHQWLTGADGRAAITSYRIGGQQLFFVSKT
jgi:tungstate transport system substrate-binding protein